jgi:hypothetical protein
LPLVVLLKGLNVGGYKTFRPAALARDLRHLDAVNIGAAGTFVIRAPIGVTALRAEIARRLPFQAEIVMVQGREIARMMTRDVFAEHPPRHDIIQFVSVLARRPRTTPRLPLIVPDHGPWLLKVVARDGRFVFGVHKRQMKVIGHLGGLDRVFGVPVTTRSWKTFAAIARALDTTAT